MVRYRLIILLTSFPILCFISPAQSAIETGATPPAEDETLIYVMRDWRFTGGGGSFWVAVNDQTVDRLSNGRYAVVRAKAGRITLSLANAGIVWVSTALDDRPGETVYLKWRVGDLNFREVGKAEGQRFLQKAKRTRGIDAPLPNNEEVDVLANLSRMGFDLTRLASQKIEPDSKHGVITLFRREDGREVELGIWSDQGFVSTLRIKEGIRLRISAGDHYFLAANKGASILKAEIQAGKEYFVWLDYGEGFGGVRLTPIPTQDVNRLITWLIDVSWIELDPDTITPRIRERGNIVKKFIQSEIKSPGSRISNLQKLDRNHGFDSLAIKDHQIDMLTTTENNVAFNSQKVIDSSGDAEMPSISLSNLFASAIDLSGRYKSKVSGCNECFDGSHRKTTLTIRQQDNNISGSFGNNGKLEGLIEGNIVKFEWHSSKSSGAGTWTISKKGRKLKGSFESNDWADVLGKWTLKKLD